MERSEQLWAIEGLTAFTHHQAVGLLDEDVTEQVELQFRIPLSE
jgi:hypothetical protein